MNVSWLDVKLGIRMLAKYPGLSAVAVIGLALAIAIGATYFAIIGAALDSTLPVNDGDRAVAIQTRTIAGPDAGDRAGVSPHDFLQWRTDLKSLTELGAFREDSRNLVTRDGRTYLVRVAAITASGFRLMRVPPLLGRTVLDQDERPNAPPVVVIGYEEWRGRFNADSQLIGEPVRFDGVTYTVVGVMPEGFAFPVRHHYWVPLHLTDTDAAPGAEPSLQVFGRLADSFSLAEARAELAAAGERMAVALPKTHANIRPQALPYTRAFIGIEGPEMELTMRSFQLGVGLLLLIVAVNVAILVYARTATRIGEIVVRSALGASRVRVVSQLFVEALVLSVSAAAIGLTIVAGVFAVLREYGQHSPDMADRMPFWFQIHLTPGVVIYVALLTVVAAVVVGVLPALKATGKNVQVRLQQFSSRGSGMQLGRTWTALIVVQVALAVAVLPAAIHNGQASVRLGIRAAAPGASDMLRGSLVMSGDPGPSRFADRTRMVMQRLEAEPEVASVTFAQHFPGEEPYDTFDSEIAGQLGACETLVATNLFEVFGARLVAGRRFATADTRPGSTAVIVDQTFAERLAPGSNVVGRRIRSMRRGPEGEVKTGPWLEIVGVVAAFADSFAGPKGIGPALPRLYYPVAPGGSNPAMLVVKTRGGDPGRFAQRFREITASVDPALKLEQLTNVADAWRHDTQAFSMLALVIIAVTVSVLLLSAAGIYSMMSFTVAGRRREIGIRAALGADARRVLAGIFGRALAQLGAGVAAGVAIAAAVEWLSDGEMLGGQGMVLLPSVVVVMSMVGLLATLGPARRGLAIQPTEALRDE
ncbi:MAG TPA: ABC transporter permease [Vicinamibacterales bacterium]